MAKDRNTQCNTTGVTCSRTIAIKMAALPSGAMPAGALVAEAKKLRMQYFGEDFQ